ncbi:MAG: ATP-binding cassette domain-containing protein [Candidatus Aegiribacteria sp.]|nr:ATP-binding cassette domain-containing protein [Candidatus Aegiribacteria sp.]
MKKKSTIFRILSYLRPYWKWMTGAMLCMVLFAIFSGASLGMILPLFDNVFARNTAVEDMSDFLPALRQNTGEAFSRMGSEMLSFSPEGVISAGGDVVEGVRDSLRESDPQQVLIAIVLGLIFIVLMKNFLGFMQVFFLSRAEQGVVASIRGSLYNHLLRLDMGFYTSARSGDVMARFTSDVGNMNWAMTEMMMSVPRQVVLLLVYLALALLASWRLALMTLLVFPPAMLFILILSKRLRKKTHYSQEKLSDFSALLQETIFGIRIVKAFSMEKFESSRFADILDVHRKTETSLQRERAFASPVTEIMGSIASGFIMWYGGSAILAGGSLSTGRFLVFLAAALSMMKPIKTISNANSRIQTGLASAERVFDLMDREPAIKQPLNPVRFDSFHDSIEFRDVCFSYESGIPVLTDVSFSLEKGEIIALVGPSGGGKSTIADLIPRFYDPDSGSILIDGSDLRTIDLEGLRKNLGVVTQETVLFNDTVRNNIAYGEESIPLEKVRLAAEVANALEFIEELPLGFSTIIGERGARLSGGQRQRLAIARAVLKDPDILIFDEATSALDTHSERQVQKAIDGLIEGRTSLIIAHRLSTITKATRVFYIDKGRIVESGTHSELLKMNGRYRLLYDMQFAGK